MKKIYVYGSILIFSIFSFLFPCAQPKLVGVLSFSGQENGGSIFRIDLPGTTPGIIHSFEHQSPFNPSGAVCAGDEDWLYGVTSNGGTNQRGAFYRIRRNGNDFTNLYDYAEYANIQTPYYHADGGVYFIEFATLRRYNTFDGSFDMVSLPNFSYSRELHIDADDWAYLMTVNFSPQLVKIKTDGSVSTTLHTFDDATEGYSGTIGVTEIPGDTLFGVQSAGGVNNGGTLFSIKKDGTGFVVHHQFESSTGTFPFSKLSYFDGKLYGATLYGGDNDLGVIFTINPDGSGYRVLHHFSPGSYFSPANPAGNLHVTSDGKIFGAFTGWYQEVDFTHYRLFKLDTSGMGFTPFFSGTTPSFMDQRINGDGHLGILMLNDDSVYVTTLQNGRNDGGVLNYSDTVGTGHDVYHYGPSVNGFRSDNVIKGTDGKLYGTTFHGGVDGNGTIFSMNADGTGYTRLHQFVDAEGHQLSGKLLEASDGRLYGTARQGGATNGGIIYRINKNGTGFQVIYDFPDLSQGHAPVGGLIEDGTGALYGSCFYGSPGGAGAVFKINKDGSGYTLLQTFSYAGLWAPYAGVIRAGDYLYGTLGYGGAENKGGIFRVRTNGADFQVLHEFTGNQGELPTVPPLLANNGVLYGVTAQGGNNNNGVIYRIDTTGSNFSVLKHLNEPDDGAYPWCALIQASDGLIYGGNTFGVTGTSSNIFRFNLDGSGYSIVQTFSYDTEGQGIYALLDLDASSVLPVQLLTFTAEKRNQAVLLSWKTAQEQNSDRFDIERSTDGIAFNKIGSVRSIGNSNSITDYSFNDNNPARGINFYHLRQFDRDGSFTYSRIVSVNYEGAGKLVVSPNPATDRLHLQLYEGNNFVRLRVIDAAGRPVLQKAIPGYSTNLYIDISELPSGWYLLHLYGSRNEHISFMKQ